MEHNSNNSNSNNGENKSYNSFVQGDNFYMHSDSDDMNKTAPIGPIDAQYSNVNENRKKTRQSSPKVKKAIAYFLVAAVSATLGGGVALAAVMYALPKTSFFKSTPLYESVSRSTKITTTNVQSSSSDIHPNQVVSQDGALTVTDIVKKVAPAVVGVSTKSINPNSFTSQIQEGMGSGMIINEDGDVLTNYHVVEGATQVKVILNNGKEVAAKVSAYDANYDIALVRITEKIDIPGVVTLGNSSSLQVGETTIAIGNPLGKEFLGTVTTGIVSAVNRNLGENDISYIQTDAAINSGNSGGPLLNSKGEVIGINTAKIGATGVEGLGFSIPIDTVKEKLPTLTEAPIMIGIVMQDYSESVFKYYNFPKGVYVKQVEDYSAAEKAGVKPGDVITKFDGKEVSTGKELNDLKLKHKSGDTIKVEVYRDGETKQLEIKLQ